MVRDKNFSSLVYSIIIVLSLFLVFNFTNFVIAVHLINSSDGGISFTTNEDVTKLFNISINNTQNDSTGINANITNITVVLWGKCNYTANTNGTNLTPTALVVADFTNTSINLTWKSNATTYLLNGSAWGYFWFNATCYTPGTFNISVYAQNDSTSTVFNMSVTVNDTTAPYLSNFTVPTPVNASNLSQTFIPFNVTAWDNYNISNFRVYIYFRNGTLLNNTNASGASSYLNFTGLFDEIYHINVSVNDSHQNINTTSGTRVIMIDTTAPYIINHSTPTPTQYSNFSRTFIPVNITANDTLAGVSSIRTFIYFSNGTLVNNTNVSGVSAYLNFTGLSDGIYHINATTVDTAGNQNLTSAVRVIILDTLGPYIINHSTPTPINGSNLSQTFIPVNITANDSLVEVSIIRVFLFFSNGTLVNNTNVSGVSAYLNFTGLDDGIYHINATVNDTLGNENSSSVTRVIRIDTTAPYIINHSTPTPTQNNNLSQTFIPVNITANDTSSGISSIRVFLYFSNGTLVNNTNVSGVSAYLNFTGLSDETYHINATTVDTAGNQNLTSATRIIRLDTTAPYIMNHSTPTPINGSNLSQTFIPVNITANDTLAGVSSIRVFLYFSNGTLVNNTNVSGVSAYLNFTGLSEGVYHINATTVDTAGNVNSTSQTRAITLDRTNPTITITSPINNTAYYANQTINVIFTSNESGFKYFSNDSVGTWNSSVSAKIVNSTYTVSFPAAGTYNITLYANDSANNQVSTRLFLNITVQNASIIVLGNASKTFNVTDSITNVVLAQNSSLENITVPQSLTTQEVYFDLIQLLSAGRVPITNNLTISRSGSGAFNYTLIIYNNTNISGPNSWDGRLEIPIVNTSAANFVPPTLSGSTTFVDTVLNVGSSTLEINLTSPVKLIIGGKSGERAAWTRGNLSLIDIPLVCNSGNVTNMSTPTNINTITRECYMNDGTDLVVWTYHFTQFSSYIIRATPSSGSSSPSSSTSSSSSTAKTTTPAKTATPPSTVTTAPAPVTEEIVEETTPEQPPEEIELGEQKSSNSLYIGIGIIVAVLVIGMIIYVIVRRPNNKPYAKRTRYY